jgi:F0F1-type ATP synthase epsilon subunit
MKITADNTENAENLDSEEERKLYKEKTQKGINEGTMKEGEERTRKK